MAKTYRNLYENLCSFRNLELAFRKARKNKSLLPDIRSFALNLEQNLFQLKYELENFTYKPRQLRHFVIHDPKTRLISASDFRDRVIHHALCNIIEPLFEKTFIHDSYANRKGRGTFAAMERFDEFKKKVSCSGALLNNAANNNMVLGFVLKADIKHYFQEVDHETLLKILNRKIKDENVMWLIRKIIDNHNSEKGMPIGNLTSQFFANVYLNELDYFVKHELRAKFYIRYVDDFIILHESREILEDFMARINEFLQTLELELHPEKSSIRPTHKGVRLLGFRCFYYFRLPVKRNIKQFEKRFLRFKELFNKGEMDYYDILESVEGWLACVELGNTYKLRNRIISETKETFIF